MKEKDSCKTTEALPFDGITGVGQNRSGMSLNYDASGRICADRTRGISSVEYDNDGHPVSIIFDNGNEQRDIWDGLGNHLATEYYTPGSLEGKQPFVTKRYAGDGQIEYQIGPDIGIPNKILVYTSFPGGYFDQNGKPHYYITDYQGNNIGIVNSVPEITEENNYYPYGEPWRENNGVPFLFSGNERLLIDGLNEYDFNARRYRSAIPAFSSWDSLNEQYPWLSPYTYAASNPIKFIDPSGKRIVVWENDEEWELRYEEGEYNLFNTKNNSIDYWNNEFMAEIMKSFDKLLKGDVGKLLIDGIIQAEETITIQGTNGEKGSFFNFKNNVLIWDYNDPKGGPSVNINITDYTLQDRPVFIGLGHELAHGFDAIYGKKNMSTWFRCSNGDIVTKCEIFAGNVENAIRTEHFLPLRKAYNGFASGVSLLKNGYYNLSPYMYSYTRNYIKSLIK